MKKPLILIILIISFGFQAFCQEIKNQGAGILFHGLVMDAESQTPLANTQIFINRKFSSSSDKDGKFAFYTARNDTIVFSSLGFKPAFFYVSDTLNGKEFIAGIYMHADTIAISEVIIIPRLANLKSDLFSPRTAANRTTENAKYNLAISAYQARVNQNKLGDAATNYELIKARQREDAYSKGQIPSDKMVGLSPLLLIPAAYLLIHGMPEKPPPLQPNLTEQEVDEIHRKYMESLRKK